MLISSINLYIYWPFLCVDDDGDDARIEKWKCLSVNKSSRYLVVFARQGGVGFSFEDSFLHIHIEIIIRS